MSTVFNPSSKLMKKWLPLSVGLVDPTVGQEPINYEKNKPRSLWSTTLRKTYDAWRDAAWPPSESRRNDYRSGGAVHLCKDEAEAGKTTADENSGFHVVELLYPGDQCSELACQWVYVFRMKPRKLVAEVHAISKEKWEICENPRPKATMKDRELKATGAKLISVGPGTYGFYVSPHRLTSKALEYLCDNLEECVAQATYQCGRALPPVVAVPDPYRWAETCHSAFLAPRVGQLLRFSQDRELQAGKKVGETLRAWLEDDANFEVGKFLDQQELRLYLEEVKDASDELAQRAYQAGAYLAYWVDSPWHHTVEIAAEGNAEALAGTWHHWDLIADRLLLTAPTREMIRLQMKDGGSFLRRHVFPDKRKWSVAEVAQAGGKPGKKLAQAKSAFNWANGTWGAATSVFGKLLPGLIVHKKMSGEGIKAAAVNDMVAGYMEKMGIGTKEELAKIYKEATNPHVNSRVWAGQKSLQDLGDFEKAYKASGAKVRPDAAKYWDHLDTEIGELTSSRMGKLFSRVETSVGGIFAFGALAIEGVELWQAWDQGQPLLDAAVDVLASATDATNYVAGLVANRVGAPTWIVKFGGPAAIVAGIYEMYSHGKALGDNKEKKTYGQLIGHSVGFAGGATMVVGGLLVLMSVPGAGWVVLAAGLLLFAGSTIVSSCEPTPTTPFQEFAKFSCFGTAAQGSVGSFSWTDVGFGPGADPSSYLKPLHQLLANFSLTWRKSKEKGHPFGFLLIEPGLLEPGSYFDVQVKLRYDRGIAIDDDGPYRDHIRLNPDGRFASISAAHQGKPAPPLLMTAKLSNDMVLGGEYDVIEDRKHRSVAQIRVPITPMWTRTDTKGKVDGSSESPGECWARVQLRNDVTDAAYKQIPVNGHWVQLKVCAGGGRGSSLNPRSHNNKGDHEW